MRAAGLLVVLASAACVREPAEAVCPELAAGDLVYGLLGDLSLGGPPDAGRNDLASSWCTDATQVGARFPGTPRTQNIACP